MPNVRWSEPAPLGRLGLGSRQTARLRARGRKESRPHGKNKPSKLVRAPASVKETTAVDSRHEVTARTSVSRQRNVRSVNDRQRPLAEVHRALFSTELR